MTGHAKRISELRTRVQKRRAKNPFDGMLDSTLYALRDQLAHCVDEGADTARRVIAEEIRRRRRERPLDPASHSGD